MRCNLHIWTNRHLGKVTAVCTTDVTGTASAAIVMTAGVAGTTDTTGQAGISGAAETFIGGATTNTVGVATAAIADEVGTSTLVKNHVGDGWHKSHSGVSNYWQSRNSSSHKSHGQAMT